ncbi:PLASMODESMATA CALLOSE-BINDING PROTEIN 5-like [Nymphaea colorata]|nr:PLASMODESMATA CALLOSE-BINDING PROTEIN 5-like [Nymphaea colorata]
MRKPCFVVSGAPALLPLLVLLSEMAGGTRGDDQSYDVELWCVAKNNAPDSALQTALDWACGHGGTDCSPIQSGGPCYDPSDIQALASFAFNDYFLKNGLSQQSCDFSGTAALTSLNPSFGNCFFPSSFSVKNGTSGGRSTEGGGVPPGFYINEWGGAAGERRASALSASASAAATMVVLILTLYPS